MSKETERKDVKTETLHVRDGGVVIVKSTQSSEVKS